MQSVPANISRNSLLKIKNKNKNPTDASFSSMGLFECRSVRALNYIFLTDNWCPHLTFVLWHLKPSWNAITLNCIRVWQNPNEKMQAHTAVLLSDKTLTKKPEHTAVSSCDKTLTKGSVHKVTSSCDKTLTKKPVHTCVSSCGKTLTKTPAHTIVSARDN